ncbi:MAG: respiratory nitrate reductase subunit gamma [Candidatus Caldarchaeum sp.]
MKRSGMGDAVAWTATTITALTLIVLWLSLIILNAGHGVQIDRNTVLSKDIVDAAGLSSLALIIIAVLIKIRQKSVAILLQEILSMLRPVKNMPANGGKPAAFDTAALKEMLRIGVYEVLVLGKMGKCEDFKQWLSHLLTMWGFIGLFITTSIDAIVNPGANPLPILHPVRILGNISGIVFMTGLTLSITRRLVDGSVRANSMFSDWSFLAVMYGTGATGFMVQWFADTGNAFGTAVTYIAHMFFVAALIPTAPWTKFIHALWRPSWVIYSGLLSRGESRET